MTISGVVPAKCRECNCKIIWHVDSMPSADAEFLFTCNKCLNKENHDCFDELMEIDGYSVIVGKKEFQNITKTNVEAKR
jgi:hypothetical protein